MAHVSGDLGAVHAAGSPGPDEVDTECDGFPAPCTLPVQTVSVTEIPETRYATGRNGAYVAYQVVGDGPRDLIYVPNWASPIDLIWEHPAFANFLRRLASFSRLVLFDKRGSGSSDHVSLMRWQPLRRPQRRGSSYSSKYGLTSSRDTSGRMRSERSHLSWFLGCDQGVCG